MAEVTRTEQEWRERLSPDQYRVLREAGTEPPFTGKYTYAKEEGVYRCAACGNELFRSDAKFDSGTGWPSFTEPANAAGVELHPTTASAWSAPRSPAPAAAPTWATCSPTAPPRPASATASTRWHWTWTPRTS